MNRCPLQIVESGVSPRGCGLLLLSLVLSACAPNPLQEAAYAGDVDGLRVALAEVKLTPGVAQRVAYRMMRAELKSAAGTPGERHLQGLEPCLRYFRSDLAYRAVRTDSLAALVAQLRVASGFSPPLEYAGRVEDGQEQWRAAAARSLVVSGAGGLGGVNSRADAENAGVWRRRLLLDPSSVVRLAAVHAAEKARDPDDQEMLLEAARLDPESKVRHGAIAALSARGGRSVWLGLSDLWANAGAVTREVIVRAWVRAADRDDEPGRAEARSRLLRVVERNHGTPMVLAAAALLGAEAPTEDATRRRAASRLVRAIRDGATRTQIVAIREANGRWPDVAQAIRDASEGHDVRVVVAALTRMNAFEESDRAVARRRLLSMAEGDGLGAFDARHALAMVGDARVAKLLEKDLDATSWLDRSQAAGDLVALGQLAKAARALADPDAYVRARTACAVMDWRGGVRAAKKRRGSPKSGDQTVRSPAGSRP